VTDRSPQKARSWRKRATKAVSPSKSLAESLVSAALGLLVVAVGGGCSFGESGIAPPTNRVFLPAGLVADPDGNFLYVVNSNSDLRFNAGTIAAVDLQKVCCRVSGVPGCSERFQQCNPPDPESCSKTRFSRTEGVGNDYCCRDLVDDNVVNCNEPQFIQDDATVEIGSFGGAIQMQTFKSAPAGSTFPVRRLFTAVRAEPSITYADVTLGDDGSGNQTVSMRCTGPHGKDAPSQPKNSFCDDNWRVRRPGGASPGELVLPEEPYVMSINDASQALFVGHLTVNANNQVLGGGVSSLDICDLQYESWRQSSDSPPPDPSTYVPVSFAGLARNAFLPISLSQAVAGLSPADSAAAATAQSSNVSNAVVYATARYSTAVSGMVFQTPPPASCDPTSPRDLTLVPGEHFFSPTFSPNGVDVRSIVFDDNRAFVLHRDDSDTMSNPAAIAVLDRTPLPDGTPSNEPIAVVQVCSGPTVMQKAPDFARRSRLFVTCYDYGRIDVVDTQSLTVTARIDAGTGPTSLVFSSDGQVGYVASFADSHVSVIDLRSGSRTENHVVLRIGLPHGYGE
jgi:DNA-binding beta-propeller fold protein YncE